MDHCKIHMICSWLFILNSWSEESKLHPYFLYAQEVFLFFFYDWFRLAPNILYLMDLGFCYTLLYDISKVAEMFSSLWYIFVEVANIASHNVP